MHLGAPYSAVFTGGEASALVALSRVTKPLSGREVARLSGSPKSTVARALQRLVEHGLVEVEEAGAGAALLYTLNREHLAATPVLQILDLRQRLVEALRAEFNTWSPRPCHASLFGSAARGDGDTKSDVDIFLVRPQAADDDAAWLEQSAALARSARAWTGNDASLVEVSNEDFGRLRSERPRIVEEIKRDGITLHGPEVRTLFRAGT